MDIRLDPDYVDPSQFGAEHDDAVDDDDDAPDTSVMPPPPNGGPPATAGVSRDGVIGGVIGFFIGLAIAMIGRGGDRY